MPKHTRANRELPFDFSTQAEYARCVAIVKVAQQHLHSDSPFARAVRASAAQREPCNSTVACLFAAHYNPMHKLTSDPLMAAEYLARAYEAVASDARFEIVATLQSSTSAPQAFFAALAESKVALQHARSLPVWRRHVCERPAYVADTGCALANHVLFRVPPHSVHKASIFNTQLFAHDALSELLLQTPKAKQVTWAPDPPKH